MQENVKLNTKLASGSECIEKERQKQTKKKETEKCVLVSNTLVYMCVS